MYRNACSNENGEIPQNRQIRRADFALTKLTESSIHQIRRNRKIHQHLLDLTKFRQIYHFRYSVQYWT